MPLRERRGEADRGLPTAPAPSLRRRLDGHARQPGGQDVLVAPCAVVRVYVIEDEAMDAAVAARPSCARRRRSIGARRGDYARSLYIDDCATLEEVREAVTTLEETERTARRVLGGAHPVTLGLERLLRNARAAHDATETLERRPWA